MSVSDFNVLGLSYGADYSDVRKAYLKKSLQTHPDKGGDVKKMVELNLAYESISEWYRLSSGTPHSEATGTFRSSHTYKRSYEEEIKFKYKSQIEIIFSILKENFALYVKITKLKTLIRFCKKIDPHLSNIYHLFPELRTEIDEIVDLLKKIEIKYLSLDDFDDVGYLKTCDFIDNHYFTMIDSINFYLESSSSNISLIIQPYISEMEAKLPRLDINCITSLDFVCSDKVAIYLYYKKVFKVFFASDEKLLEWLNAYGFGLETIDPLLKPDYYNLLICYEIPPTEEKKNTHSLLGWIKKGK